MEKRVYIHESGGLSHTWTVFAKSKGESYQDFRDGIKREGFQREDCEWTHDLRGNHDYRETIQEAQERGYTLVNGQFQEVYHSAVPIS